MNMLPIAITDAILVIILLLCIVRGYFTGVLREIVPVCAWVIGMGVSSYFAVKISTMYQGSALSQDTTVVISQLIILAIILVFGFIINFGLRVTLFNLTPTKTHRVGGMLLGLVKGIIMVALILHVASYTFFKNNPAWEESAIVTFASPVLKNIDERIYHNDEF